MISLALATALRLAALAPPGEPEPATIAEPEPPAVPAPPAMPDPVPAVGSVAITIVGPLDPEVLSAAVTDRLAAFGLSPSFATSPDFAPRLGPSPADRVADVWVLVSKAELRVVIVDPERAHTLVRTQALDGALEAAGLAAAASTFIEQGTAIAVANAWPASVPLPPVAVEPPAPSSPPAEPVAPAAKPSRPAHGNHPSGIVVGVSGGVAYIRDELESVALGVPVLVRLGYVFGHVPRFPDFRASIEGRVGSISVPHSATKLTLVQYLAESRVGFTRGPVWMFAIAGVGSGTYTRRRSGESFRDSNGVMGTLGLGASVRLTRYLALHCDGVASGNPGLFGRLGLDLGLTGYIDVARRKRDR